MYTFIYLNLMMPTQIVQFGNIDKFSRCSVWFCTVPSQFAFEVNLFHYLLSHFLNRKFFSSTYIDMAVTNLLITFLISVFEIDIQQYMHTRVCHFLAPQKFAQGFSCSPKCYGICSDTKLSQFCYYLLIRIFTVNTFYRT